MEVDYRGGFSGSSSTAIPLLPHIREPIDHKVITKDGVEDFCAERHGQHDPE